MRILIVDDDHQLLGSLKECLEHQDHEVQVCSLGETALKFWGIFKPDVVITDWGLGGKDIRTGSDLIAALRAIQPLQRCIMMTGDGSIKPPFGVPILYKPFPTRWLLREIKRMQRIKSLPLFDAR